MTRKFKMVGVLMAVVAMFALTASAAQATFTSANYPASGSGSSSKDVFDAFGSTVTCTENTFSGSLSGASETLSVTPVYKNCTAFGLPATVNMTGCTYLFHSPKATPTNLVTDLVCPGSATPDITVFGAADHKSAICHVTVAPVTGKTGVTATNSGSSVVVKGSVTGLTANQVRNSIFCPSGTHTTSAAYTIQSEGITISGNNGAVSVD